jgi:endopeptidase La
MDFPISSFMKYNLKEEYKIRSKILYNMSVHIEKLNTNNIIHYNLRNKYMIILNKIIKDLNETYNTNVRSIKNTETKDNNMGVKYFNSTTDLYKFIYPHYKITSMYLFNEYVKNTSDDITFENFINSIYLKYNDISNNLGGIDNIIKVLHDNIKSLLPIIKYNSNDNIMNLGKTLGLFIFDKIDESIFNLSLYIGFGSYGDQFKLLLGENYKGVLQIDKTCIKLNNYLSLHYKDKLSKVNLDVLNNKIENSYATFNILEECFVPVKTLLKKGKNSLGIKIERKYTDTNIVSESNNKYEILLDNCYKITTKTNIPDINVITIGYFNYDTMNILIRTAKISTYFINVKNSLLQKYIENDDTNIDTDFKMIYVKNLQIGDILSYNGEKLIEKIVCDYNNIYLKYANSKLRTIMSDFLKVSLNKKYDILKVLLMGNKDTVKCAGLLYALTKDQHRDSKNNYSLLSNILYINLNYPLQCKLKKSGYYIKDELERLKEINCDNVDLKKQVLINTTMPDNIKQLALNKIDEMKNNNSEYYKYYQYVKCLIDYPWINNLNPTADIFTSYSNNIVKCKNTLDKIKTDLDKLVYGHVECKNVIVELLAKWMSNSKSTGKVIGLAGPPGVGKTLIAKGLGKVLDLPFKQINVGGMDDASVLCGHSITYSGAQYGLIVRKMCESGKSRTILFFDELDKACTRHGINEIYNVLIHATDPNTNSEFNDKYFQEVQFPLNNVLFVFSFNDRSKIDKILLDRMEIININSYSVNDKIKIVKDFLLKEILDGFDLEHGSITMCDNTITELVEEYTFEAGVRELKRKLDTICSKLNLDRIYKRGPFKRKLKFSKKNPIVIKISDIHNYLSKPTISVKKIHKNNEIGILSGLYATTIGSGGIIPILMYKNHIGNNKFILRLTGSQGKVMKESVMFSFTIAMDCIKSKYRDDFFSHYKSGIHVHTPDGATKKDGPSAGSAFTTAFISRILNKPIKHDIAMTGEIELGGNITEIGGLEHKLTGAKKAGVKLVFCPKENMHDIAKIKKNNPSFLHIWNPENNDNVEKMIKECKEEIDKKSKELIKQHKKLKNNEIINKDPQKFRVIIVDNIKDVLKYAIIDNIKEVKDYNTYKSYFNPSKYIK